MPGCCRFLFNGYVAHPSGMLYTAIWPAVVGEDVPFGNVPGDVTMYPLIV
jgi:hypothetical protein